MFYPSDSLKRGGRFYLCWVADSWPLRFATITRSQLWSRDIRTICDDLFEVISNESGRPTNRFSLRLSSQLLRGLVRLYQRKVSVMLSEICLINANVFKHSNKKQERKSRPPPSSSPNDAGRQTRTLPLVAPQVVIEEEENEQRIVEMIQNTPNVVVNIQDITLREAAIPEFQIINDGFGEENPNQALNSLIDRTMEMMMVPTDVSAAQYSGLDLLGLDVTDKSHDKSRLMPELRVQMERLSERDISMHRKSDGADLLQTVDFEKEIPEIPEVPIPELPQPPEKIQELEVPELVPIFPEVTPETIAPLQRIEDIELEELEELQPQPKRRRVRKLIIDKTTKLSSNTLRTRIDNIHVDLRCENFESDIIEPRVPCDVLLRRPCCAGAGFCSKTASEINRMFMRNLGVFRKANSSEREVEEAIIQRALAHTTVLERIEEVEEPPMAAPQAQEMEVVQNITARNITINISPYMIPGQEVHTSQEKQPEPDDIADLPTQKRKRDNSLESETEPSLKKFRSMGEMSFRETQREKERRQTMEVDTQPPTVIIGEPIQPPFETDLNIDKENIPQNYQATCGNTSQNFEELREKDAETSVRVMLLQAGIADITSPQAPGNTTLPVQSQRKTSDVDSEPQLGSLDRTQVSLGDSDDTTDSRRFIRDQWGTEGTMIKIIRMIKAATLPCTVENLIAKGPLLAGHKRVIGARCFMSILKLKQNGFIIIRKNPGTLGIDDIRLGRMFD